MRSEPSERLLLANAVLAEGETGELAQRALMTLSELDPEAAVAALHELAASSEASGGELAFLGTHLERLSRREGLVTETDLVSLFDTGADSVRFAAAAALEARGDASLVHALLGEHTQVLAGDDDGLRRETARRITELRSTATTDAVLALLSDEDEQIRSIAVRSLSRNPRDVDVRNHLQPLLEDDDERVRRDAASVAAALERRLLADARRE